MDILIVDGPLANHIFPFRGYGARPVARTNFLIQRQASQVGDSGEWAYSSDMQLIEPSTTSLEYFLIGHSAFYYLYSIEPLNLELSVGGDTPFKTPSQSFLRR